MTSYDKPWTTNRCSRSWMRHWPKNPDVDAADRETIARHFRDALENEADTASPAASVGPDRAQWIETLDQLVGDQLLQEQDRNELVRQFDDAMGSLQPAISQSTKTTENRHVCTSSQQYGHRQNGRPEPSSCDSKGGRARAGWS